MKKVAMRLVPTFVLLLFFATGVFAQHSAGFQWTPSIDDTTAQCSVNGATCAQNFYRAQGSCTQSNPVFVQLGASLPATATTFTDSTITPGIWCYAATFILNGEESVKATTQVQLQPAPITGLTNTSVK